jgi:hypothetical protein
LWKRGNSFVFRQETTTMRHTIRLCREDAQLWSHRLPRSTRAVAQHWCNRFSNAMWIMYDDDHVILPGRFGAEWMNEWMNEWMKLRWGIFSPSVDPWKKNWLRSYSCCVIAPQTCGLDILLAGSPR